MNRFLFIMILLTAGSAEAQELTGRKMSFAEGRAFIAAYEKMHTADTSQPNLLSSNNNSAWLSRAKPSHTTSRGTIYIMPFDNMPCLVPDLKQTTPMPTMRPRTDKRMPNAFPALPWLPKGK